MTPEEEKLFNQEFDKILVGLAPPVRSILEKNRETVKTAVNQVAEGIRANHGFEAGALKRILDGMLEDSWC